MNRGATFYLELYNSICLIKLENSFLSFYHQPNSLDLILMQIRPCSDCQIKSDF